MHRLAQLNSVFLPVFQMTEHDRVVRVFRELGYV